MRIRPVDLPAPPVPPHYAQPVDLPDRLSLANSISPSSPFQPDAVEKLLATPTFLYYLPKVPITAVIEKKYVKVRKVKREGGVTEVWFSNGIHYGVPVLEIRYRLKVKDSSKMKSG
jgi:hypothetical protein